MKHHPEPDLLPRRLTGAAAALHARRHARAQRRASRARETRPDEIDAALRATARDLGIHKL